MRWAPVAWFPKGYSLTTEVFRNIVEKVHDKCQAHGIHVPCESFDGQWHSIVVGSSTINSSSTTKRCIA